MKTRTRVSAIIIAGRQLLLIHRKKMEKEYWVFPGGGVEDGETNEQAMGREIEEETGLKPTHIRFAFYDLEKLDGRENNFYYSDVEYAQPELGGPEKTKLTSEDWYRPEWVELSRIKDLEIYPAEGKKRLLGG